MSEMRDKSEKETNHDPLSDYYLANPEEEALALRAHSGSREARNELFLKKRATIGRLGGKARRYLRRLSDLYPDPTITVEDIEHQSFILFCRLVEEWMPEDSTFARFLIRKLPGLLLHYVRDTLRPSKKARIPRTDDEVDFLDSHPSADSDPADLLGEMPANWRDYTAHLPYHMQVEVTLKYWADLPSSEIALLNGRAKRSVDRDLKRARGLIKRKLEQEQEDEQEEMG